MDFFKTPFYIWNDLVLVDNDVSFFWLKRARQLTPKAEPKASISGNLCPMINTSPVSSKIRRKAVLIARERTRVRLTFLADFPHNKQVLLLLLPLSRQLGRLHGLKQHLNYSELLHRFHRGFLSHKQSPY